MIHFQVNGRADGKKVGDEMRMRGSGIGFRFRVRVRIRMGRHNA